MLSFHFRVCTTFQVPFLNLFRCHLFSQVLVPVPQYPLYSAAITLFGGSLVPYYLEETANWGLDVADLRHSVAEARAKGITVSIPF